MEGFPTRQALTKYIRDYPFLLDEDFDNLWTRLRSQGWRQETCVAAQGDVSGSRADCTDSSSGENACCIYTCAHLALQRGGSALSGIHIFHSPDELRGYIHR